MSFNERCLEEEREFGTGNGKNYRRTRKTSKYNATANQQHGPESNCLCTRCTILEEEKEALGATVKDLRERLKNRSESPVLTPDDSFTPSSASMVSAAMEDSENFQDEIGDVIPLTTDHPALPPPPQVEVKLRPSSPGVKTFTVGSKGIAAASRKRRIKPAMFKCIVPGCTSTFTSRHNRKCECASQQTRTA
jgi:hypothetical protein